VHLAIDKDISCVYFDRACQKALVGIGFVLYWSNSHFLSFKGGLGRGTHNIGKFLTLYYAFKLSMERGVNHLHDFGDSNMVI
jgi:hypothetical protein